MSPESVPGEKPEVKIGDVVLAPENAERYASGLKALDEGRLDVEGLRRGLPDLARRRGEAEKKDDRDSYDAISQEYAMAKELTDEADRRRGTAEGARIQEMAEAPKADTGLDRAGL